ncbi:DUF3757 domain-containing protein [Pseudomonas sp. NFACC08-1]|uniref:DUF3757 domain-containing protein n=1 Tax=Pseudomonas sp. NFACC08-1 TaxID=1566238 RepID=UPI000B83F605|nr:DUF3757 domain-containing protein [Pseudomonas sp. NFACC08-1]
MEYKHIYLAGLFFLNTQAFAVSQEFCPEAQNIHLTGAYYSAEGGWLGQAQTGDNSPLQRFVGGIYQPKDGSSSPTGGHIARCTYTTQNGNEVNLLYPLNAQGKTAVVKLEKLENWKTAEGYFGTTIYECTTQAKGACAFSRLKE